LYLRLVSAEGAAESIHEVLRIIVKTLKNNKKLRIERFEDKETIENLV